MTNRGLPGALRWALDWMSPPDAPAGAPAFSYYRGMRPIIWVFLGATIVELIGLHLLIYLFFKPVIAWTVTGVSLVGLVWILALANSLQKLPILVLADGVRVRSGILMDAFLPFEAISNLGDSPQGEAGALRVSLLANPNVWIELDPPTALKFGAGRPKTYDRLGLYLDDAPGFVGAVRPHLRTREAARA